MSSMDKTQRQVERAVASEVSLLLAKLSVEHGLEFETAVSLSEAALTRAYWGELPDGYQGAIVAAP